ncbi:MAG: hypothetical protein OQJ96_05950 [Flavobacteriales bacterium]|nr:hypothetical protein [Flavobacteriales bacterium]MCW8937620.1 hypothetical protein [Flavobacteriales bacterium]MCW8968984.1 hypothetical protein [Flavobacteriales bacterium]MCW8990108.1 hypothetical protein [Flavobacteriales bacterium]MCW9019826.1 hypothetical protein [Flavobacteriales bacterium]
MQETAGIAEADVDATSKEVSTDTDGDETPQEDVTAISSSPQTTGFAAAIAAATSGEVASDEDTYLEPEAYSGSTFSPSTDENREVVCYAPKTDGGGTLRIVRTGRSDSQGGFIKHDEVLANFGLEVTQLNKHTQVSLILTNGKTLVGYITLSKSRKGFYFPKKLAEQTLTLPPSGHRLPIRVKTLIIG